MFKVFRKLQWRRLCEISNKSVAFLNQNDSSSNSPGFLNTNFCCKNLQISVIFLSYYDDWGSNNLPPIPIIFGMALMERRSFYKPVLQYKSMSDLLHQKYLRILADIVFESAFNVEKIKNLTQSGRVWLKAYGRFSTVNMY